MDTFTVACFPVADHEGWREFALEVAEGGQRAAAHAEFLRRVGVRREHNYLQELEGGHFLIVAIWEGVDPDRAGEIFEELVANPRSDHERYIATHVVPKLHGVAVDSWQAPRIGPVSVVDAAS